jgi:hypothetical protein
VHEVFHGQTDWQGEVEVLDLNGDPEAKRCYAWSHPDGPDNQNERFVPVLEIPPAVGPQAAVNAAIVAQTREARKQTPTAHSFVLTSRARNAT